MVFRATRLLILALSAVLAAHPLATCVITLAADNAEMACCVQEKHDCMASLQGENCCKPSLDRHHQSLAASKPAKASEAAVQLLTAPMPAAVLQIAPQLTSRSTSNPNLWIRSAPLYVLDSVFRL